MATSFTDSVGWHSSTLPLPSAHPDPSSLSKYDPSIVKAVNQIRSHLPPHAPASSSTLATATDPHPKLPYLGAPKLVIVCGSGLSGIRDILEGTQGVKGEGIVEVGYSQIDGFGESTVLGHQSSLAFGYLRTGTSFSDAINSKLGGHQIPCGQARIAVVAQLGRFHSFEGHPIQDVIYPMRVFKALGAENVIITSATGGLNPELEVGSVVVLQDHVSLPSLTGMNPLFGKNHDAFGPRFPPMSDAYDYSHRRSAFRAAYLLDFDRRGIDIREGIYAWVSGPTYETRAEAKFLRDAGADVVGMSTIPEIIAARHAGMRVLALSLVTNKVVASPYRSAKEEVEEEITAVGKGQTWAQQEVKEQTANHEEVLETGNMRANDLRDLVEMVVGLMD